MVTHYLIFKIYNEIQKRITIGGDYIKEEKGLYEIPYTVSFKEMLVIGDMTGIILDSIKIFGVKNTCQLGNVIKQETDFYIRTINNHVGIYPMTPCDSYYLIAKKIVDATNITIESSDYISKTVSDGNYTFALKEERSENKMLSDSLPKTNSNPRMPLVQASNGKNCRDCSKSSVCKYQDVVTEEVERLIGELEKKELPLSVNINCNEFLLKQIVGLGKKVR